MSPRHTKDTHAPDAQPNPALPHPESPQPPEPSHAPAHWSAAFAPLPGTLAPPGADSATQQPYRPGFPAGRSVPVSRLHHASATTLAHLSAILNHIAPVLTLDAASVASFHAGATALWHEDPSPSTASNAPLDNLILAQHRANFDLWHQEDAARDPDATDAAIAQIKHAIDALNQQRNDLVEQIDTLLLSSVTQSPDAPLHSETPGLIIDRLSILALKIFHTEEQMHRSTPEHQARNRERLALLTAQRDDLAACLNALWVAITTGTRRFKLYRQLKMYNDPELNPVLYANK